MGLAQACPNNPCESSLYSCCQFGCDIGSQSVLFPAWSLRQTQSTSVEAHCPYLVVTMPGMSVAGNSTVSLTGPHSDAVACVLLCL